MIPCPSVPFHKIGILQLRFITVPLPPVDAYEQGRQDRTDGKLWHNNPFVIGSHDFVAWERGWTVVDYAMKHVP